MNSIPAGYKQTEVGVIPEDWEVSSLESITDPKRTISYGIVQTGKNIQNGIRCLRVVDIEDGKIKSEDMITTTKAISDSYKRTILKVEDLVMPLRGKVGDIAIVKEDLAGCNLTRGVALVAIRPDWSACYCRQYISSSSARNRLEQSMNGSALQEIPIAALRTFKIAIPPTKAEQEAIAEALSDTDALIESLEQLITKKRHLKQGAMQELLTGKRRLPGFSGVWKVKRLGDVGNCLRGVTYRGHSDLSQYDTAHTKRLLRSNNVQNATVVTLDILFVNDARVSENQLLRDEDILICMANGSKVLVGKAGFFKVNDGYEYTFGAFMGCFRSNSVESNSTFVFYLFQTGCYRNYINNLLAGSSINNLSPSSIESLEFPIPPLPEQTAIATILSDMDTEITALETKLVKTRQLKQGMMHNLLTGRIRLV